MAVKYREQLTHKRRYYPGDNPCDGAVVHQTANTARGANAKAHANYQSFGSVKLASWHKTIDDEFCFISYLDIRKCWHAGDGRGPGNTRRIGYELCVNSDGDYRKTIENAAEVIGMDARKYGWSRSDIGQHNEFSDWGKDCPRELRGGKDDISWNEFVDMVMAVKDGGTPDPKPEPVDPPEGADGRTDVDGYWGTDVTNELQYIFNPDAIDGEVWRQNSAWRAMNPALTWGWKWEATNTGGSPLIYKMQDWLGADYRGKRDGDIGPEFIKGLQRRLKRMGYYSGSIDGRLDKASITIKGLQRAINAGTLK